jgi:hypothetical protein
MANRVPRAVNMAAENALPLDTRAGRLTLRGWQRWGIKSERELASLRQVFEFIERQAGVASNSEGAGPASIIYGAYQVVTSMEDGLMDAHVFADGVAILAAEALHDDDKLGAVMICGSAT